MDKNVTAFFTGHRVIPEKELPAVRYGLYNAAIKLYLNEGYRNFICGGAIGFDTEAAECVIAMKERFPDVTLSLYLPCRDQTLKWNDPEQLAKYKMILGASDTVTYVSPFYTNTCMMERNRRMADDSSVCIAYRTHSGGGTDYTVRYAGSKGIRIINIGDR